MRSAVHLLCLLSLILLPVTADAGLRVENVSREGLDLMVVLDQISNLKDSQGVWRGIRLKGFTPLLPESLGISVPVKSVLIGAPSESKVEYDIIHATSYDIEEYAGEDILRRMDKIRDLLPTQPVEIGADGYYRHRRFIGIRLTPLVFDRTSGGFRVYESYRVRIRFVGGDKGDNLGLYESSESGFAQSMLNRSQAKGWVQPWSMLLQEGDYFSSSPNWIKIKVDSTGMYLITGKQLENAGIDLSNIDVASLRLYSGGGLPLSESLADTNPSWMHQVRLKVCDGGDGHFDRGDSLIFYGLGWRDWADLYDPKLSHTSFYKSFYSSYNCYWLTWGGMFSEQPKRMSMRNLPNCIGCSYFEPQTFEERIHRERDLFEMFNVRAEDGWYWYALRPGSPFFDTFTAPSPDVSTPARLKIRVASWAQGECSGDYFRVECKLNGTRVIDERWSAGLIDRYIKDLDTLVTLSPSGEQQIVIENRQSLKPPYGNLGVCDRLILAWYEIFYRRKLELDNGSLYFEAPDTTGYVKYAIGGLGSNSVYIFDVTDQFNVAELTGANVDPKSFEITFFDTLSGKRRRYALVSPSAMLKVLGMEKVAITNIRYRETKPYCVVTHADLVDAARTIADFHDGEVVTLDEIYNEFAWGLPDVTAIRDFLRWRYWHGPLSWVLLLGDATWDVKGRRGAATYHNYVPSYERRYLPPFGDTYNTDDWFAYLEPSWHESLADFPTIAISRLPAISPEDAQGLVERTLAYETSPEPGMWQGTVILIADDDRVGTSCDGIYHTDYAEELADDGLPPLFRQVKIYLTEYEPEATGLKSAARNDFIESLNRGALIANFVGHGDPFRLAQEEVYNPAAIDLVNTGPRRTFFIAASCNVSRFDDPVATSMAEDLIHRAQGGTIGSLASTHLCKAEPNQALNLNFLQQLFQKDFIESPVAIGDAAAIAKFLTITSARNHDLYWANSEMYALFGDPALELAYPRYRISFVKEPPDTLRRKGTYSVEAVITSSGQQVSDFNGDARIFVREAEDTSGYVACDNHFFDYELPGTEIFRGEATAVAGEVGFRFLVASAARRGPRATVRCFVSDGRRSALGLVDSLEIDGEAPVSDETGPEIELLSEGRTISSGDTLLSGKSVEVRLTDRSGVAIKSLSEISPISVAFDDDERVDLADSAVALDGDFTRWIATFTVPPLGAGYHKLSVSAFDNLSNLTTRDYNVFIGETVLEPSNLVYAYPNPAREFCHFIWEYDTDEEVEVEATIMTIAGRKIWKSKTTGFGPYREIIWNCRDSQGDRVANGTYIVVVKARSLDNKSIRTTDRIVVTVLR